MYLYTLYDFLWIHRVYAMDYLYRISNRYTIRALRVNYESIMVSLWVTDENGNECTLMIISVYYMRF